MRTWFRFQLYRPAGGQILISLLIVGLGLACARALIQVNDDLRLMYTEYTLGAVELGQTESKLMRYRNTVIQALKAPAQEDYEELTARLATDHASIQQAMDRYAAASLRVSRSGRSEEKDLRSLKQTLEIFFMFTNRAQNYMARSWIAGSPQEAKALRNEAELMAANNSGPALFQVSLAFDQLYGTVAEVAKDMRDEGSNLIHVTSVILMVGSFVVAFLNLFATRPSAAPDSRAAASSLQPEHRALDLFTPAGGDRSGPATRPQGPL